MIQTSEEGREMLTTLFIESKLHGPNLDSATIRSVIERTAKSLKEKSAGSNAFVKDYRASCAADKKALGANIQESREKEYLVVRHLEAATREQRTKSLFIQRANEEKDNYEAILSFAKDVKKGWIDFYAQVKKSYDQIEAVVGQIGAAVRGVKNARRAARQAAEAAGQKRPAFIELPEDFATNLVQVKADFENNYEGEYKHIVVNMLEILADGNAVNNKAVRLSLGRVLETLADSIRSRVELLEEENETQDSLFASVIRALEDGLSRNNGSLAVALKGQANLEKKTVAINASIVIAKQLSARAVSIHDLRSKECRQAKHVHDYLAVKKNKLHSVLSILHDLVNERFPALKQAIKSAPKARGASPNSASKGRHGGKPVARGEARAHVNVGVAAKK